MDYLEKTFRWFGSDFGVTLEDISQTGATGIVTALHHIPNGEVWSIEEIKKRKEEIELAGLKWSVVESVNIHESIKQGTEERTKYIENYKKTLRNLAQQNIKIVCYNFMPVLDWTRTNLDYRLEANVSALGYDHVALAAFDLFILRRENAEIEFSETIKNKAEIYFNGLSETEKQTLKNTVLAGLPGTREVLSLNEFQKHLDNYKDVGRDKLKSNLNFFLNAIIPEAEKLGVLMCVHPDDPPFSILGLPRIVSNYDDIKYLLNCYPSYSNGLTFCSGSLGASPNNDLLKIFDDFGDKIHFLHLRSVQHQADGSFYEAHHLDGNVPMEDLMISIIKQQQKRLKNRNKNVSIPVRPDHGHVILDDLKRMESFYPGYSTLGRLKGLAEITGLEKGIRKFILT